MARLKELTVVKKTRPRCATFVRVTMMSGKLVEEKECKDGAAIRAARAEFYRKYGNDLIADKSGYFVF